MPYQSPHTQDAVEASDRQPLPCGWNRVRLPAPAVREVAKLARLRRVKELKRLVKNRELLGEIAWLAERMAEWPAQEQRPRRPDLDGNVAQNRDGHCWNPCCFNCSLDQSHGLIAETSSRREKDKVRPCAGQPPQQFRKNLLLQCFDMPTGNVTHERIVIRGETAETIRLDELSHSIQGEDDVEVAVGVAVIVVVVGDGKFLSLGCRRDASVGGIAIWISHVEWRVPEQMNAARGNQAATAAVKRLLRWSPWHIFAGRNGGDFAPYAAQDRKSCEESCQNDIQVCWHSLDSYFRA